MGRSFSIIDHKVAEADFFLKKLKETEYDFFAARCFTSAFTTAARSVTYAIQAVMKPVAEFDEWYRQRQEIMKADPIACFFHRLRTVNHHIGDNLVSGGSCGPNQSPRFRFMPTKDIPEVPANDVATTCTEYFRSLVELIYQCYVDFGAEIDSHQHYTLEHFGKLGKTIEDAEEEIFGVRGWTHVPRYSKEFRWQAIRDQMTGCEIDDIFREYLCKEAPRPPRPESS